MATEKQRAAARRNVRKAQAAAKRDQTLENLPEDELRRAVAAARRRG